MTEAAYSHQNPRPLPETMPLRDDLTRADVIFGAGRDAYLGYHDGQYSLVPEVWKDRANRLFFKGGKLADIGLKPKEGLIEGRIYNNLGWLLGSFEPKHEQKEATAGFALMCWCDPIDQAAA